MTMNAHPAHAIGFGLVLYASYAPGCFADGRSAGQAIVYQVTQVINAKADYSSLPAYVREQAAKNLAAANGKKTATKMTLSIDRVDAEGNAHVNVTYSQTMEGISGIAATAMAATQEFQGTLTADGRLLPTYDPNMPATLDSHGRYSAAEMQNVHAQQMQGTFGDFNTFVTGAAKHPSPKTGDAWHVVVQDAYGTSRQYDFSTISADSVDANVAPAVSMKSDFANATSSHNISATGHYDAAQRMLTSFHEEVSYSSTTPNGISSSGVTSVDINLGK